MTKPLDRPIQQLPESEYEEDPLELGDIELKIVSQGFLPRPEDLVFKNKPKE